jgi:hypothetical protein
MNHEMFANGRGQEEGGAELQRQCDLRSGQRAIQPRYPRQLLTVAAVTGRYDDLTAGGGGPTATDLYKNLAPGYDELFVRYYAKYQSGVEWHHTGVWVGSYNPALDYPSPQAGLKPNGDDRFSISFEPVSAGPNPRMDLL